MNVLAVGAHPDDVELNCAGTLAAFAARGDRVFIATTTNGCVGSASLPPAEITAVRMREAAAAAALIGAEYICLGYEDEMFYDTPEVRLRCIELIRRCQADVILTHSLTDYLPDHERTGKIFSEIPVMVPVPNIKTASPPGKAIPQVYLFEPAVGIGFDPEEYVDITPYWSVKQQMLRCHQSQILWLKDNLQDTGAGDDPILTRQGRILSEFRGLQCGVTYAEAFVRHRQASRVTPGRLLP